MIKTVPAILLFLAFLLPATAQDKPRVFVQGKGSENLATNGSAGGGRHWASWGSKSTLDSHDEGMEVTKDLQKNCSGVVVTLNQVNADYTVMLNRESKQNRGLLRTNSQLQVANRIGDIIGTNSTRTVGNAAKDACALIMSDWQAHGRLNAGSASSSPATPAAAPTPASPASASEKPEQQSSVQPQENASVETTDQPQPVASGSSVTGTTISNGNGNGGPADAARRAKQHKACLELAKDNPSITCK
jgi:hypothetical protein